MSSLHGRVTSVSAAARNKQKLERQRDFFEGLAQTLKIKKLDDWYNVRTKDIYSVANNVLSKYNSSLFKALSTVYPDHQWLAWKFDDAVPWGFWNEKSNQRKFFDWLAKQLNLKSQRDWYALKRSDMLDFGGRSLLQHYNNSLSKAVMSVYSEFIWDELLFQETPYWQWSDQSNHRLFFDFIFKKLGYKDSSDWYKLNIEDIARFEGMKLLENYYQGCYITAITSIYAEHKLDPLEFKTLPKGFFKDSKNHKIFLEHVARKMNLKNLDGWYDVSIQDFYDHRGAPLLRMFEYSLLRLLESVYPEISWKAYKMQTHVSKGFWAKKENRREYFDFIGEKLGIKDWTDWYKVSKLQLVELGALSVLNGFYNESYIKALQDLYPEHDWQTWKFISQPDRWLDKEHQKALLEQIGKELGVVQMDDWYNMKTQDITRLGGSGLLERYNKSLITALKALYPDYHWDDKNHTHPINKSLSKSQFQLFSILQSITEDELFVNFIIEDKEGKTVEVDVYIPKLNLAFEYQGIQHYEASSVFVEVVEYRKQKDSEKANILANSGISLIIVPYWWKSTKEELIQIIQKERPDIVLQSGKLVIKI